MVSIFTGLGSGFERGSLAQLGAAGLLGSGALGRNGEQLSLNAATGNLLISQRDEFLVGRGQDASVSRTYNSLGDPTHDDNGDRWQQSTDRRVYGLTGTLNASGSTVKRLSGDGSEITYTWNGTASAYVATDGAGAYDKLVQSGSGSTTAWTWTDGDSQIVETYSAYDPAHPSAPTSWRITSQADTSGNTLSYSYVTSSSRLDRITTQNGEYIAYSWDGSGNITDVVTHYGASNASTSTRTHYAYTSNKLTSVTVDLTPDDNSVTDGAKYVTTYAYDANGRVSSITETDGSSIAIGYDDSGRVTSLTQTVATGVTRVTSIAYYTGYTTITDPLSQVTRLDYDGNDQLTKITTPVAVSGGSAQVTQFAYDSSGNVTAVTDALNKITSYTYDGSGNVLTATDPLGNVVTRTYDTHNHVLTETTTPAGTTSTSSGNLGPALLPNFTYWGGNETSSAGTLTNGAAAYYYTGPSSGTTLGSQGVSVTAGDTITYELTLKAGSTSNASVIEANYTDGTSTYQILSGPGTITPTGTWANISGLSTTAETRIRITHNVAATGVDYLYFSVASTQTVVIGDPSIVRTTPAPPRFKYDAAGQLRIATDKTGNTSYFVYDHAGRKVADVDQYGNMTEYRYDADDRVVGTMRYATAVSSTNITTYLQNPTSTFELATIRPTANANDLRTWKIFDDDGRVVEAIDGAGDVTTYAYDGFGRLVTTTAYANKLTSSQLTTIIATPPTSVVLPSADSAHDGVSRIFYDKDGLLVGTLNGEGYLARTDYDDAGQKVTETAFATQVTDATLRATGTLAALLAAAGTSTTDRVAHHVYNDQGQLRYDIDALGHVTEYNYRAGSTAGSEIGDVRTVTRYATAIPTPSAYTAAGIQAAVTTNTNDRSSYAVYDAANRLAYAIDASGAVTGYGYDAFGRVIRTTQFATTRATTSLPDTTTMASWATSNANANDRITRSFYDLRGELQYVVDAEGFITRFDYDNAGRQTATVRFDTVIGSTTFAAFTDSTTLATIAGLATGAATTISTAYDHDGRVDTSTDGQGFVTKFVYNANGTLASSYEAYGLADQVQTSFTYDNAGRMLTRTDAAGASEARVTTWVYDGLGDVVSVTDPNGNTTTSTYDHLGRKLTQTDPLSGVTSWQYDGFGDAVKVTDPRANASYAYYDNLGRVTATRDAEDYVTETSYTVFGEVASVIRRANKATNTAGVATSPNPTADSARDETSAFTYDKLGRVFTVTDALGNVETYTLTAFGQRATVTNAISTVTTNTYDRRGLQKTQVVDSGSGGKAISSSFAYDAMGRQVQATDPLSHTSSVTFDRDGRVNTSTDVLSHGTTYTYDSRGNLTAVQDVLGNVTRRAYDKLDRLIYVVDTLGDVVQYTYDANGQVISSRAYATPISLSGLATSASVAAIAALVTASSTADELTRSVYDADGRLRYTVDPGNFLTEFDYDATGNVIRRIAYTTAITSASTYTIAAIQTQIAAMSSGAIADARITRNVYSATGQLNYTIDALGDVTAYVHDAFGNIVKQRQVAVSYTATGDPSDAAMATWLASNGNTTNDRISRAIYDKDGQLRFAIDAGQYVTQYTYDAVGDARLTTRYADRFNGTGGFTAFTDSTTLAQAITYVAATPTAAAAVTELQYDTAGRAYQSIDAAGTITRFTLDQLGRATTTEVAYGTADASVTTQTFDALGRITAVTRAYGQPEATTTSYTYDALGRMLTETDGRSYTTTRTYDANGNVLTVTVPLDSSTNAVTTNTYDAFGNLVKVVDPRGNSGYFYYDALDRLVLQVDPNGYATATTYLIGSSMVATVTRYAAVAGGSYSATVRPTVTTGSNDETTTFSYDKLNRLTGTADAAGFTEGYAFDAFGNRLTVTNKLTGITYYTYDARGLMLTEKLPEQSVAANGTVNASYVINAYSYDSRGNRVSMVEAQGLPEQRTTLYAYDALDRLVAQTGDAVATLAQGTAAPVTHYQYDRNGNLVLTTDPNGAKTFSYYDHLNRKVAEINAVGTFTAWTYDGNGNVVRQKIYGTAQSLPGTAGGTPPTIASPSLFREIDYSYDRDNRLLATSTPSVTTGKWNGSSYVTTTGTLVTGQNVYDAAGNIVQTIDGNGVSAYTYYDKAGHKVGQVDGAGYLTAYELDQDGNVTKETRFATPVSGASVSSVLASLMTAAGSTANDRITLFTYDKMGRRLTEKRLNVASASVSLTGGMTTATADALITYTYNGLGEVASKTEATTDVTSGLHDVTNYSYDLEGRLTTTLGATITDSTGATVRMETDNVYDGLNNLTRTRVGTQTVSSANDRITTYVFGAGGRLMGTTNAGVNAAETVLATYYVYDLAGHVVQQNQIRNVSDAASNTVDLRTTISYDALGRAISQQSAYLAATLPTQFDFSKNLIVNGSFESIGTVTSYASWGGTESTLPGWTKSNSGGIEFETTSAYNITPSDGTYAIDTDGGGGAGSNIDISQTITGLTAGQAMQLSLDHIDPRGNNPIQIYWNGTLVATVSDYGTVMMTSTFNLTAIAGSNVLRLVGLGPTENQGAQLDNVRLFAALPSPVTSGWVNGDSQGVVYDAYGEVVAQSVNGTLTTQMVYDTTGHVVQSNSGDGTWKAYINDGSGNASLTIQSTGTADIATLTVAQALALATNNGANTAGAAAGNGVVVTIGVFDGRNQQTQTLMPFRDAVTDSGNVVTSYTVGQYGINTSQAYNAFGEVTSQTDARGNTTSFVYNTMGRLTAQNNAAVYVTDQTGAASSSPVTTTQYNYYDLSGRLVATRDANNNLTTRVLLAGTGYGGADPLTLAEFHPDSGVVRTAYDVFGDATKLTDALGYVTTNKFDHMGNLIEVDHPTRTTNSDGSAGDLSQLIDYYTYDGLSERVGHSNNVIVNPIYGAPVGTYHYQGYPTYSGYTTYSSPIVGYTPVTETTAYDSEGRVVSTTDFGGHTTQYMYQWNGAQATTGLATYGAWTKIVSYVDSAVSARDTLDAFGHEVAKTDLGGNVYSYAFNKAGQLLTQTSVTAGGIAAENLAYTYYNTGKVHTITDNSTRSSVYYSASITSTFSYDRSGNRLTTNYVSTSNYLYSFYGYYYSVPSTTILENSTATYDAMNRVTTISDPGDSGNKRPSFSQTRTYDANGNVRSNITTHQGIDSSQNLITTTTTDAYWFAYDSMNRFVVTEGTLSGTAGASGTTIIAGTTGTAITYDGNSQRATATSFSGYQYSKETYAYTADGYLTTVGMGTSWDGITFTSPIIRSVDKRDALGRVTIHNEYDASGATYNASTHLWSGTVVYGRTAYYNNLGQVTSDQVSVVQGGDTNVSSTSYIYAQQIYDASTGLSHDVAGTYLSGNVLSQYSYNTKNGTYQYGVTTRNNYVWYDSAQQKLITAVYSGNQTGTTTSTFSYDGNGHVAQVTRTGQNANTISYTTDASGQIMARKQQTTGTSSSPAEYYFYLNNVTIGEISNNGSENLNYAATITQQTSTPGSGPFANGATSGTPYANFDLSYQAMNPTAMAEGGAASSYTVQAGDTLSSVAQSNYGDSSLWYLIAQANGLNSNSQLTAGQTLSLPSKVSNAHNNATTFKPYNPNAALGDVQPGAPIPPKANNCGVLGIILLIVIAVAVTALTYGALTAPATAIETGTATVGIAGGATLAVPTFTITAGGALAGGGLATVAAGAIAGAAGSLVSQAVGLATGIQQGGFNWKGLALAALGGGISAGVGQIPGINGVTKAGVATTGVKSVTSAIGRAVLGNLATQGIAVATHLQDKFDWTGVAVAGVVSGAIGIANRTLARGGIGRAAANITSASPRDFGYYANQALSGVAGAVAGGAARSLLNGSDFGDNVLGALPDVIGSTVGNLTVDSIVGSGVKQYGEGPSHSCFVAGTLVHTDGGLMPIEKITVGTKVLARDELNINPMPEYKSVTKIFRHNKISTIKVLINVGQNSSQLIETTSEHPFFVNGEGWSNASDLKTGDQLILKSESAAVVVSVENSGEVATVYNIKVDEYHTYFVGDHGIWVHNKMSDDEAGIRPDIIVVGTRMTFLQKAIYDGEHPYDALDRYVTYGVNHAGGLYRDYVKPVLRYAEYISVRSNPVSLVLDAVGLHNQAAAVRGIDRGLLNTAGHLAENVSWVAGKLVQAPFRAAGSLERDGLYKTTETLINAIDPANDRPLHLIDRLSAHASGVWSDISSGDPRRIERGFATGTEDTANVAMVVVPVLGEARVVALGSDLVGVANATSDYARAAAIVRNAQATESAPLVVRGVAEAALDMRAPLVPSKVTATFGERVAQTPLAADSVGPGAWRTVNEAMSGRAAAYQSQITGRAGQSYLVDGVKFDGFEAGTLLDAKGPGYATFVKDGEFRSFFRGSDSLLDQAQRQVRAANGAPITWHVAESPAADAMRALLNEGQVTGIKIVHTPVRP